MRPVNTQHAFLGSAFTGAVSLLVFVALFLQPFSLTLAPHVLPVEQVVRLIVLIFVQDILLIPTRVTT